MTSSYIHPSAIVESNVVMGENVKVWHFCHVRKGAILNEGVTLGKDVYVDEGVEIGGFSRVQNGVSLYKGLTVSPFCFIGPHVIFTNDQSPRVGNNNWQVIPTKLSVGSSIGAGAIIRCGITLGEFSMVGAGAIVTKDVPPFHLAIGVPAKNEKMVCACGQTQSELGTNIKEMIRACCRKNLESRVLAQALKSAGL